MFLAGRRSSGREDLALYFLTLLLLSIILGFGCMDLLFWNIYFVYTYIPPSLRCEEGFYYYRYHIIPFVFFFIIASFMFKSL